MSTSDVFRCDTRMEARVLANRFSRETPENWVVKEHDGWFEVLQTPLLPNFKVGDRVHWKEAPDGIIGLVRKEGIGPDKVVKVYWGTQDGNAFIGDIPSRQLELDDRPFKTNYS